MNTIVGTQQNSQTPGILGLTLDINPGDILNLPLGFLGNVLFTGEGGTLNVSPLANLLGMTIGGFALGDTVVLAGVSADSVSVNNLNQLVLKNGANVTATLNLDGPYANVDFGLLNVHGGVEVVALPKPATVADYQAYTSAYDSLPNGFTITDTAANIKAGIASLDDPKLTSITATNGVVMVASSVVSASEAALNKIVGGFDVGDSVPNLISHMALFNADHAHIDAIVGSSGSGTLTGGLQVLAPEFTLIGSHAALTVAESTSFHNFILGAGAKLSVAAGDTLTLSGASNVLSGALGGAGKINIAGGGATSIGAGATANVASLQILGTGTTVALQTDLSYGGAFSQAANTTLALAPNTTLTLSGTSLLNGTIFGAATLAMTGGSATIAPSAHVTTSTWTSDGTALTFNGARTFAGAFNASSETLTLNGLLALGGPATLTNVTLGGSNQIRLADGAEILDGMTLGGATTVANFSSVVQNGGNVVLGDVAGGVTKLINFGVNTTWAITDDSSVLLGNAAGASISNSGIFEKTGGTGVSEIAARIANGGHIDVSSGTLDLNAAVTGKGSDIVSGASTLEFDSNVASTQTVGFQGDGSTLDLTNWGTFSATISGFDTNGATNDTISVAAPWNYVGFNASNDMMTFADGATQHSVKLTGDYLAADFHHSVVGGMTQVTYG